MGREYGGISHEEAEENLRYLLNGFKWVALTLMAHFMIDDIYFGKQRKSIH
jgi:hypothetical protein